MLKEKLEPSYEGNEERYEKWEEPIKVINTLEVLNKMGFQMPSLQKVEGDSLTPKEAIEIHNKALFKEDCPNIVFGRPHAGEFIPEDISQHVTEESYKSLGMVDRGTEFVFKSDNIPSVGTKISRMIIDPNRSPLIDVDPKNPKAIGRVLWKKGIFDEEIYKKGEEQNSDQINDLVERFYLPYYNGMMGTIATLADRRKTDKERILVVDGHSFPTNEQFNLIWNNYEIKDPKELPLFIIGDRDGESCDGDIREAFTEELRSNFEKLTEEEKKLILRNLKTNEVVGVNQYLKGVHNVQFFGQKQEGINSIQLELNESAFVDDEKDDYYQAEYNFEALEVVKKLIEKTCLNIDKLLKK